MTCQGAAEGEGRSAPPPSAFERSATRRPPHTPSTWTRELAEALPDDDQYANILFLRRRQPFTLPSVKPLRQKRCRAIMAIIRGTTETKAPPTVI